ncbi:MAG: hypothetical protein NTY19_19660 [Planctomycetota bacterium]|nr:hypothetical protein [Planctomycetota bacterium]
MSASHPQSASANGSPQATRGSSASGQLRRPPAQICCRESRSVTFSIVLTAVLFLLLASLTDRAPGAEPKRLKLKPGDRLPQGVLVDVLPYVDPEWDVVSGDWRRDEGGLITEPSKMSRVMLPLEVRGDYDLETEFTRTKGEGSVYIVLPVGGRVCLLLLAHWGQTVHGLGQIDGLDPRDHNNPANFRPGILKNERRYRVLVSVRTEKEDAAIDVSLDGKPIIAWHGRQSSLSLAPYVALPYPLRAGMGAYDATVTFHRTGLRSVSGKTTLTPHPTPPFKDALDDAWTDLLAGVDPQRDAVHGRWIRLERAIAVAASSAEEGFVRLMLPEEIEGSYDLAVEFTRSKGSESVTLNLPVATRACTLHFGSFLGGVAGLEQIDGKHIGDLLNPAVRRPGSLVNGIRHKVQVSVRLVPCPRIDDHDVQIDVWLDGRPLVRWSGRESSLSLSKWKMPEARHVGLGANHSLVTFHAVRLRPIPQQE